MMQCNQKDRQSGVGQVGWGAGAGQGLSRDAMQLEGSRGGVGPPSYDATVLDSPCEQIDAHDWKHYLSRNLVWMR